MFAKHKISDVKFKQINFCPDISHSHTLFSEDRGPGEVQVGWLQAHRSTTRRRTLNSGCTRTGGDRKQPPSRDRDQLEGQDLPVSTLRPHHLFHGVQSEIITGAPSRQAW